MHRRSTTKTAALSYDRVRQLVLIGMGWTIIALGLLIAPLPGPGGIPVIALGGMLLLRNSADARRLFVRAKRRWPRLFFPFEALRQRFRKR